MRGVGVGGCHRFRENAFANLYENAYSCRCEAGPSVGVHVGRRHLLTMATPVGTGPIVQDVAPKGGYPPVSKAIECNGQLCSV